VEDVKLDIRKAKTVIWHDEILRPKTKTEHSKTERLAATNELGFLS